MHKRHLGFSLIELSIVILIIGLLVLGVSKGSRIISKAKLSSAQTLTKGSPVNMDGLVFWLETSLDTSFVSGENQDGTTISRWKDSTPTSLQKLDAISGSGAGADVSKFYYNPAGGASAANTSGPTYISNGINGLPTLRFTNNNSTAYRYITVDSAMRNVTSDSFTMFFVFKYRSGSGYIMDRACLSAGGAAIDPNLCPNGNNPLVSLVVSPTSVGTQIRSDYGIFPGLGGGVDLGSATIAPGGSYIVTIQRKYGVNFVSYLNGGSAVSAPDNGYPLTMDPVKIGRHLNSATNNDDVDVSEVILIAKNIRESDRKGIESYLGKKYNIKVN